MIPQNGNARTPPRRRRRLELQERLSLFTACARPEDTWALLTDQRFSRGRNWLTLRKLRPHVAESTFYAGQSTQRNAPDVGRSSIAQVKAKFLARRQRSAK
jgi:hypothetical protein